MRSRPVYVLFPLAILLLQSARHSASPIPVRYTEGLLHGFLALRASEGETLAHGDLTQVADGNLITSHLVFHFRDGSVYDETTVYSQHRNFRVLKHHLVKSGPSFPYPEDSELDGISGQLTMRTLDEKGKPEIKSERMKLPADLANGLVYTLVKNIPRNSSEMKASMIVTTPKPRLVQLVFSREGYDTLRIGGEERQVTHYTIKVDLGGVTGLVAPFVGKEPPAIRVWVLDGEAPAFIKSVGPLYPGGPIWEIEPESPIASNYSNAGIRVTSAIFFPHP